MNFKNVLKSKKKLFFIIGTILSTIILILIVFHKPIKETLKLVFDQTDEIQETKKESKNSDETTVSFQTNYVINSQSPNFQLINPKDNTVNMQYTIAVDGKKIYETNLVPPNKAKNVDMIKLLRKGTYKIDVYIKTFDVESNKECNSIPVSGIRLIVE